MVLCGTGFDVTAGIEQGCRKESKNSTVKLAEADGPVIVLRPMQWGREHGKRLRMV